MEQELINPLSWQYCSRKQAIELKELGIINDYQQEGCFYSAILPNSDKEMVAVLGSQEDPPYKMYKPVKLYSLAELGLMIGRGTLAADCLYQELRSEMNKSHSITLCYKVEFLADFVISCLKGTVLKAYECNERLNDYQRISS